MSTLATTPAFFDEISIQKGLVRVLTPLLDQYLSRMKFKNSSGVWIEAPSIPAIYIGNNNELQPALPSVYITFNGDTDTTATSYESGLEEIEDPNDPPNLICVPFQRSYITYLITLSCDSGPKGKVNRGEVRSASSILRTFRDNLMFQNFRNTIHTEMASTVKMVNPITPVFELDETTIHDMANMTITFDTTSTVYDLGEARYIQTINYEGTYKRFDSSDPNPIVTTGTVTST